MAAPEKKGKKITGLVISDKMNKSRVVVVEGVKKHPVFGKYLKTRKKFMAHDEENKSKRGHQVVIRETTPLSKRKRWEIIEILSHTQLEEEEPNGNARN